MDLYKKTSYQLAEKLTKNYSTSFSLSSTLFDKKIRPHIYAIYGMVRIADEIVDSYGKDDAGDILDEFENDVYKSIESASGYSANPIVFAFAQTAKEFGIGKDLIKPFFESMRMDLAPLTYDQHSYEKYIYGSAEVVGLMCLRVFVGGDNKQCSQLEAGARSLGRAYQNVNFLRDLRADTQVLGRCYFPGIDPKKFSENDKETLIDMIEEDFKDAREAIDRLPQNSRKAVRLSYMYYYNLLIKIKSVSASRVMSERLRVSNFKKGLIYSRVRLGL